MPVLFILNGVSADGYFEGPGHDISWHRVDAQHRASALAQLSEVDALVFGARTYALMASFWPTDEAKRADPEVARLMNDARKLVISRKMERAAWRGSELLRSVEDVAHEKARTPRGLAVLGSGELGAALLAAGLVDEIRLFVMPVVLGGGTPHLKHAPQRDLELLDVERHRGGNLLLRYRVLPK